jgi:hypothetical protein
MLAISQSGPELILTAVGGYQQPFFEPAEMRDLQVQAYHLYAITCYVPYTACTLTLQ